MPVRCNRLAMLCVLLMATGGCRQPSPPAESGPGTQESAATGTRPVPTLGPDEALPAVAGEASPAPASPAAFDPAGVPESHATLPPFPLVPPPEGLDGLYAAGDRGAALDREHMIAGEAVVALDGRVFRQRYRLDGGDRAYSELEFQRAQAEAITALGGVEVSRVQYTPDVNAAFGGRAAVDRHYHGTCASHGCENHTYLVRQHGQEYWIQVSTGGIPPHGQVTVLQRPARAEAERDRGPAPGLLR